jgi:hypothetical protein
MIFSKSNLKAIALANRRNRKGIAAVEAAVCLPVLALIVFGSIEVSTGLFHEYNAQSTAYELSKVALAAQTNCEDVQFLADEIIPQFGFSDYDITINVISRSVNVSSVEPASITTFSIQPGVTPTAGLEDVPRGTLLELTINISRPPTTTTFFRTAMGEQISAQCIFCKEY